MPTPPTRRLLGPVAVLGLLAGSMALAPVANARVVLGQSIDGVKLGESRAQVKAQLGAPTMEQGPDQHGSMEWNYGKPPFLGAVTFAANGQLSGMFTTSKQQKTAQGIGVGSSLAQVRKAYPQAKCSMGPFGPTSLICTVQSKYKGRTVETSFPFYTRSMGAREVGMDFA
jgi:hypothetical protein